MARRTPARRSTRPTARARRRPATRSASRSARRNAGRKKTARPAKKAARSPKKAAPTRRTAPKAKSSAARSRKTGAARKAPKARQARKPAKAGQARKAGAARKPPKPARRQPSRGTAAPKPGTRKAVPQPALRPRPAKPALDRERRRLPEADALFERDRTHAAAETGRNELIEHLTQHTETSPALAGGDVDANWEDAYAVGDEAPGGDNPTPDQDRVDDIGRALGVTYEDSEELRPNDKIADRDQHRWELDPASSDDWPHDRGGEETDE